MRSPPPAPCPAPTRARPAPAATATLDAGSIFGFNVVIGNTFTYANPLPSQIGVTKLGLGTLNLTGSNPSSGPFTVSGGILGVSASNNLGDGSATNTIVLNGGT